MCDVVSGLHRKTHDQNSPRAMKLTPGGPLWFIVLPAADAGGSLPKGRVRSGWSVVGFATSPSPRHLLAYSKNSVASEPRNRLLLSTSLVVC